MERQEYPRIETLLDRAAEAWPDRPALLCEGRTWSFREMREESHRRAVALIAHGFAAGDVVAARSIVTDDLLLSFFACCYANLAFFHLATLYPAPAVAHLLGRSHARTLLVPDGTTPPDGIACPVLPLALPGQPDANAAAELTRRTQAATPQEIAAIWTTSGTTGSVPKVMAMPHDFYTWSHAVESWWVRPGGVYCIAVPHGIGNHRLAMLLSQGGAVHLATTVAPAPLEEEMRRCGTTTLLTVPSVVRLLVEEQRAEAAGFALDCIITGTAPCPPTVQEAVRLRYGAITGQDYGSSEAGWLMSTPHRVEPTESIGVPLPDVEARLVDEDGIEVPEGATGELVARTPVMLRRYLDDDAASARVWRDGWIHTGDRARRDTEGWYHLMGREALRVNVGGFKVVPEEIEAFLETHPGVREAVVLSLPDEARGEIVRAVIVPHDPAPTAADLRRFCMEHLPAYKVPRAFEFRRELPRSPFGKVLRQQL